MYINNESSLFQALDQSRRAKKAGEKRNSNRAKNGGKSEGESLSQVERTLAYPSYTGRANLSYISLQTRGPEPFTGETKGWLGQRGGPPNRLRQTAKGEFVPRDEVFHLLVFHCSVVLQKMISFTLL